MSFCVAVRIGTIYDVVFMRMFNNIELVAASEHLVKDVGP